MREEIATALAIDEGDDLAAVARVDTSQNASGIEDQDAFHNFASNPLGASGMCTPTVTPPSTTSCSPVM
jgi:hypothetical protein